MNLDRLKAYMDTAIPAHGLTGIDCIIYQNHKEIFRHATGAANLETGELMKPHSVVNIYSATKIITCVAILQLFERGQLSLSEPVHKYIPEFEHMKVKYGTFTVVPAKNKMTIFHLLNMTSGLSYDSDTPQLRAMKEAKGDDLDTYDFVKTVAQSHLLHEPGEGWNYGNSHDVLGLVVERVAGVTFGEYLQTNIFEPLGIKNASFRLGEHNQHLLNPQYGFDPQGNITRLPDDCYAHAGKKHESGGGGLIMSADDYILFANALACGGVGATGERIISKRTIDLMATNYLADAQLVDYHHFGMPKGNGYGLGVNVVVDNKQLLSIVPNGSFSWGGAGGVNNLIDPSTGISFYISQHLFLAPKHLIGKHMLSILYSQL